MTNPSVPMGAAKAWEAYLHHRFHPSLKMLAESPLSDWTRGHLESCPRCAAAYAVVESKRAEKSPKDWCQIDPCDFGFIDVGDIRTPAFDRVLGKTQFMNAPEVCVIVCPPRISFDADVVVAQAVPERFAALSSGNAREDVVSSGYLIEAWNIYQLPMGALILFEKSKFPTVYRKKAVPAQVVRRLHAARREKFKAPSDEIVGRFRESERKVADVTRRMAFAYRSGKM